MRHLARFLIVLALIVGFAGSAPAQSSTVTATWNFSNLAQLPNRIQWFAIQTVPAIVNGTNIQGQIFASVATYPTLTNGLFTTNVTCGLVLNGIWSDGYNVYSTNFFFPSAIVGGSVSAWQYAGTYNNQSGDFFYANIPSPLASGNSGIGVTNIGGTNFVYNLSSGGGGGNGVTHGTYTTTATNGSTVTIDLNTGVTLPNNIAGNAATASMVPQSGLPSTVIVSNQTGTVFSSPVSIKTFIPYFTYGTTNPLDVLGCVQAPQFNGHYIWNATLDTYSNTLNNSTYLNLNSTAGNWVLTSVLSDPSGNLWTYINTAGVIPTNSYVGNWFYLSIPTLPTPNTINIGTLFSTNPISALSIQPGTPTSISGYEYNHDDTGGHILDVFDTATSNLLGGFATQVAVDGSYCGVLNLDGNAVANYENIGSIFVNMGGDRALIWRVKGVTIASGITAYNTWEIQYNAGSTIDYQATDEYGHNFFGNLPHSLADSGLLHSPGWNTFWGGSTNVGATWPYVNVLIEPQTTLPTIKTNGAFDSDGTYIYADQAGGRGSILTTGTTNNPVLSETYSNITSTGIISGNGSGLTNQPYFKTMSVTGGSVSYSVNSDGSTNVSLTISAGSGNGNALTNNSNQQIFSGTNTFAGLTFFTNNVAISNSANVAGISINTNGNISTTGSITANNLLQSNTIPLASTASPYLGTNSAGFVLETNRILNLGYDTFAGVDGNAASWMLGVDASGKMCTNVVPSGGGGSSFTATNWAEMWTAPGVVFTETQTGPILITNATTCQINGTLNETNSGNLIINTNRGQIITSVAGNFYCVVGVGNLNNSDTCGVSWLSNSVPIYTNSIAYQLSGNGPPPTSTSITIHEPAGTTNTWGFVLPTGSTFASSQIKLMQSP